MPQRFDPRFGILPPAQREVWQVLRPAAALGFVLYGGTAIALQLGHRQSVDFDFFSSRPIDKPGLADAFPFLAGAAILQDERNTLVVSAAMPSGPVKLSFFGGLHFGRINDPLLSSDGVLLAASPDDLLATKLKAILDRAELRDYRDIAALLAHGVSLPRALSGFRTMFGGEPRTVLTAIGYFEDGDLASLTDTEKKTLLIARDRVRDLPDLTLAPGVLPNSAVD
jgi:hypothetical protein